MYNAGKKDDTYMIFGTCVIYVLYMMLIVPNVRRLKKAQSK